jgi:hypothetical protein
MKPATFPHPQPAPLILTPKDEFILQQFAEYRLLTAQEITALFYKHGSHTYARSRLSRLAGNRDLTDDDLTYDYPLYRFGFPTGRLGNHERIFSLSFAGRQLLSSLGIPVSWHFRPAKLRTYSHSYYLHDLTRNRFVVALLTWAKSKPNLSIASHLSYELSKQPPTVEIPVRGTMTKVSVIPDGVLLIRNTNTGERLLVLLEIDQNTQAEGRLRNHFKNTYGTLSYRIVYATQGLTASASQARLKAMCTFTTKLLSERKREKDSQYVRFTAIAFDRLYDDAARLFEEPSWYLPADAGLTSPVPLLTDAQPSTS